MKKIGLIMGSDSDLPVMEKAMDILDHMDVPYEVHIYSAHRTPEEAIAFAKNAEQNGYAVLIAAAGMAAHLAGVIAANTTLPVIGIPCKSKALDGMDALLSTVMMPPGIPVATVGIDGGANAALLAVRIMSVEEPALKEKLADKMEKDREKVLEKDRKISKKGR